MNEDLKRRAADAIDQSRARMVALSQKIHDHPEQRFEEHQSAAWLVEATEKLGWETASGICDLPTAWRAELPNGNGGPTVAFLSEYDALPEIGHACGHNLMAVAPVAAALGLQSVLAQLHGKAVVLGTPAEEGGGGKVIMGERGGLRGIDAALLVHPASHAVVQTKALACEHYDVEFFGKPAHAAMSPDKGVNALNALIQGFNNIDALRQHIRTTARVHGVIRRGGDAPNVVPEYTKGEFIIRAADNEYLDELIEKVRHCFEAGALASGARFEWKLLSPRYETINSNETLSRLYYEAMQDLGVDCPMDTTIEFGSTDMGNVSWLVPSIQPMFKIADHIPNHTREFTAAAATDRAYEAMFHAAKAMAFTAIDLLSRPELMEQTKREFQQSLTAGQ